MKYNLLFILLAIGYFSFAQEVPIADTLVSHIHISDSALVEEPRIPVYIPTSKDSIVVTKYLMMDFVKEDINAMLLDTSLEYSQMQDPAFKGRNFYQTLGNQGLASKNLNFTISDPVIFDYGVHAWDIYKTTPFNLESFNSYKPYTILDYSQGPSGDRREAQLNVDHCQHLAKNLVAGVKLYMNSSLGDYSRQKAENYQVAFHSQYKTDSERYVAAIAYIYNQTFNYDNFGITYDSIFEQNIEPSRKLFLVNNTKTESEMRDMWLHASQYFYLLNPQKHKFSIGKIGLDTDFNRTKYQYWDSDPDVEFYPAFYAPDSTNTFDSTTVKRLVNDIYWKSSKAGEQQLLNLKGGFVIQNNSVSHHDSVKYLSNWVTTYGEVWINPDSVSNIWGKIALTAGTNATENFLLEGTAERAFSFGKVSANVKAFNSDPQYSLLKYHSSHYKWDSTSFKDIVNFQAGALYKNKNTEAGFQYNTIGNYTYLNQNILPTQASGAIHLMKAWVYQDFSFWKFDLSAKGVYQFVSNKDVIRLPDFMGKMSFQFHQPMFDNALYTRIGFDVLYTTGFYADSWSPELNQFYLQDEKAVGNYPYIDAYIKLQVKRARIFLMFTHVNSGLMGYDYYMTPHYPMKDRYFKYGISWFFHD